jgi:hypothetical protein
MHRVQKVHRVQNVHRMQGVQAVHVLTQRGALGARD